MPHIATNRRNLFFFLFFLLAAAPLLFAVPFLPLFQD
jgi:hypothetical protein